MAYKLSGATRITAAVHREMSIASAYRQEPICELVRKSWEAFKLAQGSELHKCQRESKATVKQQIGG